MAADSSSQLVGWDRVKQALSDLRTCSEEAETLVTELFDHLGEMTDRFLAHEIARHDHERHCEEESLKAQVERLAELAAQLTRAVAQQQSAECAGSGVQ
jgi:hypothetical protein